MNRRAFRAKLVAVAIFAVVLLFLVPYIQVLAWVPDWALLAAVMLLIALSFLYDARARKDRNAPD